MSAAPASPAAADSRSVFEGERLCERCGYDLRGLPVDRCPECGLTFDPATAPLPRIPWLLRARLGRVAAFWQTVCLVTLSPRAFAAEFLRASRVAARDARRFRSACVGLAVGSLVAVCLAAGWPGVARRWPDAAVLALAAGIAGWVFFGLIAASTPFDPIQTSLTGEQIWLSALNGYASAPLAFSPLPAASACVGLALLRAGPRLHEPGSVLLMLACAGAVAQFTAMAIGGAAIVRQVRRYGFEDTLWAAVGLPVRWFLIACLTAVVMVAMACPLSLLAAWASKLRVS